jgi:hypothetical protein
VDERARRIGANEVLFREVNERIEDLNETFGIRPPAMTIVCECGDPQCLERIEVPIERYEGVRADPARFLVAPGHVVEDVEDVVERHDGYEVIEKREGGPAEFAAERAPED